MSRILFEMFGGPPDPPVTASTFALSPPGGIGLPARDAVVLLRFDETAQAIQPKDAAGSLQDMGISTGLLMPVVVDGVLGRARQFNTSTITGLVAKDITPGASLLTRDMTIQAVLTWSPSGQTSYGSPGMIVQRGYGFSVSSSETRSYALVLDTTGLPAGQGTLRWEWQDVAGASHVQVGAVFTMPESSYTMLTATRRWVSPTEVVLRYYVGDVLIGEVHSVDGSIGGATTGTVQVGASAITGTTFGRVLSGAIDELLIVDYEMTREEIEATWLRITRYQPLGVQLIRELHDPGFPLPTDPASDVQLDLRMTGNGLGYAAAQAENVRVNILPTRAYGSVLEDWETTVRVTPEPSEGIDERRARVVAKIRQRRGSTIPGFGDALVGLLDGADDSQLEYIAFSNQIVDDFSTFNALRWDGNTVGGWFGASGTAQSSPAAGTYLFDGATKAWVTMRQTIGGDGKRSHILAKLVFTTPQSGGEVGLYFENAITGDYLLLGLRDVAGSFQVKTESFISGVSQGVVAQATIGANPAAIWLHLYQTTTDGIWKAAWSTTSATSGFTTSANITHPTMAHWAGAYFRSTGAIAGAAQVNVDDVVTYAPFSGRPFNAYVMLDRGLGFSPDIDGANSVVSAIKHGFIHAAFITNGELLAGDPDGGAGIAPTGGY